VKAHKVVVAPHSLAAETDAKAPLVVCVLHVAIGVIGKPAPGVPYFNLAAAVAFGNSPAKIQPFARMILDVNSEATLAGGQRELPGGRPRLQHAAKLETQIEVQPVRLVLVDNERASPRRAIRWLGGSQ